MNSDILIQPLLQPRLSMCVNILSAHSALCKFPRDQISQSQMNLPYSTVKPKYYNLLHSQESIILVTLFSSHSIYSSDSVPPRGDSRHAAALLLEGNYASEDDAPPSSQDFYIAASSPAVMSTPSPTAFCAPLKTSQLCLLSRRYAIVVGSRQVVNRVKYV